MHSRGEHICQWSGDVAVYHAERGIVIAAHATSKGFVVEFVRVAENHGSIVLRHGSRNVRINNGWVQNSFVSGKFSLYLFKNSLNIGIEKFIRVDIFYLP